MVGVGDMGHQHPVPSEIVVQRLYIISWPLAFSDDWLVDFNLKFEMSD